MPRVECGRIAQQFALVAAPDSWSCMVDDVARLIRLISTAGEEGNPGRPNFNLCVAAITLAFGRDEYFYRFIKKPRSSMRNVKQILANYTAACRDKSARSCAGAPLARTVVCKQKQPVFC